MLDFQILKFVVANQVKTTNVHHHTNFVKIGQTDAEISLLTIFKLTAMRHVEFLNIWFLNSQ